MSSTKTDNNSSNKEIFREKIDSIDTQILDLLAKRIDCAKQIGEIKRINGEDIYVPSRECLVFDKLLKKNDKRINDASLRAIYREIISAAVASEGESLLIAYLGPMASYTHQAAQKKFGSGVEYRSMHSIPDVFSSVKNSEVKYGVVPIENSTEGAVFHSLDMLAESSLHIVDELYLSIEHCLISKSKLEDIKRVCSKDQAIGQCRDWLRRHLSNAEIEYSQSTSDAVKIASQNSDVAAIASQIAADYYSMPIVEKSIQDKKDNFTRFLVIGKNPKPVAKDVKFKTSIVVSINDRAGALYEILLPFSKANINLTRIESRPSRKKLWDYYFFIDFLGHWEDECVKEAVSELKESSAIIKWLGSYPAQERPTSKGA